MSPISQVLYFSSFPLSLPPSDMNSVLTEVLLKSCVSPVLPPEKFSMECALMVAILHANVGSEVGKDTFTFMLFAIKSLE